MRREAIRTCIARNRSYGSEQWQGEPAKRLGAIRLYHVGSYGYGWEDAGGEVKRYGTFHFRLSGQQAAGGRQDG